MMNKKAIGFLHFASLLALISVSILSINLFFPLSDGHSIYAGNKTEYNIEDSIIRLRIILAGDAMMHEPQVTAGLVKGSKEYDFKHYFEHIAPLLKSADLSLVNLETTLCGGPYTGYPQFCSPDAYAFALKDAGFNYFVTSNNHSVDKGLKGINRTIMILDSFNIKYTGTFRNKKERDSLYPSIVNIKGMSIAVLNYSYGTNGIRVPEPAVVNLIDTALISEDIKRTLALSPDIIMVAMHWGNEYEREPGREQKRLADFLLKKGVDVIIGSHPHVIQPVEFADDPIKGSRLVVWSLGNLISNQRRQYTNGGLLVQFDLVKNINTGKTIIDSVGYYPVWVYKASNPVSYHILPASHYDNEEKRNALPADDRNTFSTFIKDTRKHLKRDTLRIKEFIF